MADGFLSIGSQTPVSNTPNWVTPDVLHGRFATSEYSAAGPLTDFENAKLRSLGKEQYQDPSRVLNDWFLTEQGLNELSGMLQSGCYRVAVPEHAALLVIAALAVRSRISQATELLAVIAPWMNSLRFYPEPTATPVSLPVTVHLESVGEVRQRLDKVQVQSRVQTQNETLNVWVPLHDEFVRLVVDSCEFPSETDAVALGQLFVHCNGSWLRRAGELLLRYADLRRTHTLSGKPDRRGKVFFELRQLVQKRLLLVDGALSAPSDSARTRELLRATSQSEARWIQLVESLCETRRRGTAGCRHTLNWQSSFVVA